MLRISAIVGLGLAALGGAQAGTVLPVDLAGVTLPSGDVSATMSACTNTATASGQVCSAPTPSGNTYMNAAFSTYIKTGAPTASSTNQPVTTGATTVPFLLANQSSPADNMYVGGGAQTDTQIVVDLGGYNPVTNATAGVFNVDAVYTMIQGDLVTAGDQGLTVTLNGLTSGDVSTSYTFTLTAGTDYRGYASTQTVTSTGAAGGGNNQNSLSSQQTTYTDSNPGGGTGCNGGTGCQIVVSDSAFGGPINSKDYYLDVQELELPTVGNPFANGGLLQSIVISDDAFGAGNTSTSAAILLSGISLDQTPEPGTIVLLGIGIFGIWKVRRSKTAA